MIIAYQVIPYVSSPPSSHSVDAYSRQRVINNSAKRTLKRGRALLKCGLAPLI